jgi:hypothetical protein
MKVIERWDLYCRNLVVTDGKFAPFAEASQWRDFGKITFNDHVAIWSRVQWLLSMGPEKWQQFLFAIKGRVNATDWSVDQTDLVGAVREALQATYGLTPLNFDDRWKEWVKETYPSK